LSNKVILTGTTETILPLFTVSPNPTFNDAKLDFLGEFEPATLKIYNTLGALVLTQKITNIETIVSLSNLDSGAYMLSLTTKTKTYVHKIIKL
jgi:hypothetical protein